MKKTNISTKNVTMDSEFGDDYGELHDRELGFSESNLGFNHQSERSSPLEGLSNVDYSLNSPLISDEIDEFLKFIQGVPYRKSWNKRLWSHRKDLLKEFNVDPCKIRPTSEFHRTFARILLDPNVCTKHFKSLITGAQRESKETWEIPHAFLKAWINLDVTIPDKDKVTDETMKYGALWAELHIATLLLNAMSSKERQNLCRQFNAVQKTVKGNDGILIDLLNFGTVMILNGLIYFKKYKILADRHMLLMMKDVTNARMQSLMSLQNRQDKKFDAEDIKTIENIYKIGDQMILRGGNKAYDGIKLIEPICNLRLTELAQRERNRIPLCPDFKNHIRESIQGDGQNSVFLERLFLSILEIEKVDVVLVIYGSFRHWGHPFLEYLEGLKKLREQTTLPKQIDTDYANKLASDLAYIVLKNQFDKNKKWFVDVDRLPPDHKLRDNIVNNTWPTPFQIKDFQDEWHRLPLSKCFEIPDVVDPSLIYADKSHSVCRSEIIEHIKSNPMTPIPSKKVLETFINTPATNWKEFLTEVNDNGLDMEHLVIGLRGKEREIKRIGRFFALMSWKLRDYFVITEYLIKLHFVPLFSGLTMADDLNTVVKKMLDTSNGQGLDVYDYITMANHIDYEKWNNHQRGEANNPVFTVMGQFLGYPSLITRTHEFFEKSLIYYNNRTDLMYVRDGVVLNKDDDTPVCWNGQAGGLEGLRQKGWSIVNLLVIKREGRVENTRLSILAQGDNQVVCTQYKLQKTRTTRELDICIDRVLLNNDKIMRNIEEGTRKLGLLINKDETIKSADYLNYGKVPIFRGKIKGLESKRWSRAACVSNDQLPTISNILSTISSNALSVGHFAESPVDAICHYNFLGNLTLGVLNLHNPAVKGPIKSCLNPKDQVSYMSKNYKILLLYLDPSLGGICGMSLTRFLIRSFPDPLTESLAFWQGIFPLVSTPTQRLISAIGSPIMGRYDRGAFAKLLENPLALNLRHSVNPVQMIKDEIRRELIKNCDSIKNKIVQHAIQHSRDEEESLYAFLETITPRFPRFLSEYKAATYLGMTESLVGLFQNSKTIRNVFSRRMKKTIDEIIVKSEIQSVKGMIDIVQRGKRSGINVWRCSSEKADVLRQISWGNDIVGATIPHPFEMIKSPTLSYKCPHDEAETVIERSFLSVLVPKGIPLNDAKKGPYKPYLGSRTTESTSLLRPWENESKVPLIRRAAELRKAFNWFVNPDSHLGRSILNNLHSLTGEVWIEEGVKAQRSGSALHRFSCSRQSQGGYIAQSPFCGTWMLETTDSMHGLGEQNYDFLFQALLLYGQITTGEIHRGLRSSGYYHYHIQCHSCIREINEITLDAGYEYHPKEVSDILNSWKPEGTEWITKRQSVEMKPGVWGPKRLEEKSYHIGKTQGFLFGDMVHKSRHGKDDSSLFPLVLRDKLNPKLYMTGLITGLIQASSIAALYKRSIQTLKRPKQILLGQVLYAIDLLSLNEGVINIWRSDRFLEEFITVPHRIPSSYPLNNSDLGALGRNYMRTLFTRFQTIYQELPPSYHETWIFGDCMDPDVVVPFCLSKISTDILYVYGVSKSSQARLREIKEVMAEDDVIKKQVSFSDMAKTMEIKLVGQEVRHALKGIKPEKEAEKGESSLRRAGWDTELVGQLIEFPVSFEINPRMIKYLPDIPRIQDPLISGLRLFQCPTGAHYKMRTILEQKEINFNNALVCGDGSGGMTSMVLRLNPTSKAIFNSLLVLEGVELKGSSPSPPSAISCIPEVKDRCINYDNAWENPSDLTHEDTWEYFVRLKDQHELYLDLIIVDAETNDYQVINEIERLLAKYIHQLLPRSGSVIFKTHMDPLLRTWDSGLLSLLGPCFAEVSLAVTTLSSSHTSEVYIVMKHPTTRIMNCKPSLEKIIPYIKYLPAMRSPREEFDRALQIPTDRMFEGVPPNLISDPSTDLVVLLISVGVETGVSALIGEMTRQATDEQQRDLPYYILLTTMNSLFTLTRGDRESSTCKDQVVYNWGSFLTGFLFWLAWNRKIFMIKKNAQQYISGVFLFSWSLIKTKKKGLFFRKISMLGRYSSEKNVYLDSKMALIGNVIRVLTRLFPQTCRVKYDETKLNHLLNTDNAGLTINLVKKTSDVLHLLENHEIDFPEKTPYVNAYQAEEDTQTWTAY
ncbi:RNA-dependent RNA polymerase [Hubei lepidoptera virus 2]|uniref:Replicase n=1 Tax=Hubei lepidoptera virus 2 TaxID=1922904 RepID=A0A1L3KMS6_9RHAB|nr:RNA-dependent RNA polymerase [Hubei lepidoptera virus 2]APG78684.1 RNA-dependent RNA polymerase [Hubei lepidoptera virus 2]